jgi:Uncharacterized conserved protein (DUF2190)
MSFQVPLFLPSGFEASADLSASQFRVVKLGSTGIAVATAATDNIVGVLQDKPAAAGRACQVMVHGISRVVASAAITKGAFLTATTGGKVVTTTTAGQHIIGTAVEDAAADGDVIACLIMLKTI